MLLAASCHLLGHKSVFATFLVDGLAIVCPASASFMAAAAYDAAVGLTFGILGAIMPEVCHTVQTVDHTPVEFNNVRNVNTSCIHVCRHNNVVHDQRLTRATLFDNRRDELTYYLVRLVRCRRKNDAAIGERPAYALAANVGS